MNLLLDDDYPLFECFETGAEIVPPNYYPPAEMEFAQPPVVVETVSPMRVRKDPRAPWTKQKEISHVLGRVFPLGTGIIAPYVIDQEDPSLLPPGFTELVVTVASEPPHDREEGVLMMTVVDCPDVVQVFPDVAVGSMWTKNFILRITLSHLRPLFDSGRLKWGDVSAMSWGSLYDKANEIINRRADRREKRKEKAERRKLFEGAARPGAGNRK